MLGDPRAVGIYSRPNEARSQRLGKLAGCQFPRMVTVSAGDDADRFGCGGRGQSVDVQAVGVVAFAAVSDPVGGSLSEVVMPRHVRSAREPFR